MDACSLCARADVGLDRVSGIALCTPCMSVDPSDALAGLGATLSWRTRFLGVPVGGTRMRFGAEVGLRPWSVPFALTAVPELITHKVSKLAIREIEVGDPVFDRAVYLRTSSPPDALRLLSEGVQSALLALLSGVRTNDLGMNLVKVEGSRLQVRVSKLDPLDEAAHQALKLETAALVLHVLQFCADMRKTPSG